MKKYILFGLLVLLLISCEKTITEYVDSASWKIDERVQTFSQYILNLKIVETTLLFHSPWYRGYLGINGNENEIRSNIFNFNHSAKIHINDLYSIGTSENKDGLIIYSNDIRESYLNYYNGEYHTYFIKPSDLDSTLTDDAEILRTYSDNENITSNGQNQILFFFSDYNPDDMSHTTYYCLINISQHYDNNVNWFTADSFVINQIPGSNISIADTYYANNQFYCSLGGADNTNFIITESGDIIDIPLQYTVDRFFEFDNKTWCKSGPNLYNSIDGVNWEDSGYTISPYINFFVFDGKLCGFRGDNLYELDLENSEVFYLDVSGLDYHYITAIDFNEDRVYLSTIGGLYSKRTSDFFKDKSTENQRNSVLILNKE